MNDDEDRVWLPASLVKWEEWPPFGENNTLREMVIMLQISDERAISSLRRLERTRKQRAKSNETDEL